MDRAVADYTIFLDRFDLSIQLGIHAHEAVPQRVRLSIEMAVSYLDPPRADAIEEVLDYDFVRDGILALAKTNGFALQETLIEAIASLCLSDARVQKVRVRSMKLDVYPDARVGCEVVRSR